RQCRRRARGAWRAACRRSLPGRVRRPSVGDRGGSGDGCSWSSRRRAGGGLLKAAGVHAIVSDLQLACRLACSLDDSSAIILRLCSTEACFPSWVPPPGGRQVFEMKTFSANADNVKRDWFVVDATDKTLG